MRERFIADAVTSTRGKAFAQSLEGRPNDFVRQKRLNINAMYYFKEGWLDGTSVGLGYRWREAPAVGVVAVPFYLPDGTQDGFVPDPGNWIKGEAEHYWDLTLAYRGQLKMMNKARYTVRLVIRNLFPDDDLLTPRAIDSFTGDVLQQLRLEDRQFVVSFELKI
jgi:outer membrane receptor protein involved in Fe transport